jgi:hypothetical protein
MIRRTLLKGVMAMVYGTYGTWGDQWVWPSRGGNPPMRPDQANQLPVTRAGSGPAPASPVVVARRVIIVGPGGGLFVYSPTAAAGNLVASISATAGTDPYGNAYVSGIADYSPGALQGVAVDNGMIEFTRSTAPTGPWTVYSSFGLFPLGIGSKGSLEVSSDLFGLTNSAASSPPFFFIAPSGSTVTDTANITAVLTLGGSVCLLPGTFQLNALVTVTGQTLCGLDMATVIQPGGGYAGPLLAAGAKGVIRNLSVEGSGSDAITVAGGIAEWWLTDLYFSSNAGFCINATPTGPAHGRIRGIRGAGGGAANGGGIAINGGTGGAVTAEVNIYDIDIQGLTTSEVLFLSAVTDVLVSQVNGSIAGASVVNGITVQGACQTCQITEVDVGGGLGTGVAVFRAAGGNSPTDCLIQGKLQSGAVGLVVNDGTARSRFYVDCTRQQGDGAQFNGSGSANKLMFMGNLNNQAAGVAYDINSTSSAHVFIDAPQYGTPGGGAVTANLNCTIAGNHVTHSNPPAGSTSAGFAPAGW